MLVTDAVGRVPKQINKYLLAILFSTLVGFLVGCGWIAYAFATAPDVEVRLSAADRVVQMVAYLTCPAIAIGLRWQWTPLVRQASTA